MHSRGNHKRKKQSISTRGPAALEDKVRGGRHGFALHNDDGGSRNEKQSGLYGSSSRSSLRKRLFGAGASRKSAPSTMRPSRKSASMMNTPGVSTAARNANVDASMHIVCAISENLAKETCVASLDAGSPVSLQVVKQGNGDTYAETLSYLQILQPDEILLNEGRSSSHLTKKIISVYGQAVTELGRKVQHRFDKNNGLLTARDLSGPCDTETVVKFIPRSLFDQTKGADLLRRIARTDSYDATVLEEYILLSSSYAVLQYTQLCLGANFAKNCLHLSVDAGGMSRMAIDRSSLVHLELLANAKTGKMANSLIGTIDSTITTVGSRMLRSNLLAPPTDMDTINTRLDLVDAFLHNEEFLDSIGELLASLPDINRMLSGVALMPAKKNKTGQDAVTPRVASKGIAALVCIKSVLSLLPDLAQVLVDQLNSMEETRPQQGDETLTEGSSLLVGLGGATTPGSRRTIHSHHLLRAIIHAMRQPELDKILGAVNDVFTDSTTYSNKPDHMRHQECFALKRNTNGMLDAIRDTFLQNCDDIYRLADQYAEKFNIRVTVRHSTARGYYLAIPEAMAQNLPDLFIQLINTGRFVNCTTEEVHSLNSRVEGNVQDMLLITHEHIQKVLDSVRLEYEALASLSDAIALLDMCHAFADNVVSCRGDTARPLVNSGNDLTIRNGRYGIAVPSLEQQSKESSAQFIPNDTYAPGHRNFVVLTGANGSGKSTYLKQLAIIVVLAHCGSYVPAKKAIIPIRDRLCTRIGIADDQEHNISTFMQEMKETAFICRNAGPKSLILIDELGRATSNEDGVAIAWAVCEHLRSTRATTFFVTHYPQLSKFDVYPGIANVHLAAQLSDEVNGGTRTIFYSHKLKQGSCPLASDYGIEISGSCGWPHDVVTSARDVRTQIEEMLPDCSAPVVFSASLEDGRRATSTAMELCKKLKTFRDSPLNDQLRNALVELKRELIEQGGENIVASLFKALARGATYRTLGASARKSVGQREEGASDVEGEEDCDSSLSSSSSSGSSDGSSQVEE